MFKQIDEYMLLTKTERQAHIDLSDNCIEIGGNSPRFRGLLAHHLKTTIPKGMKVHLCHACNNDKCSNPNHLYWGTPRENYFDAIAKGTMADPHTRKIRKEARRLKGTLLVE